MGAAGAGIAGLAVLHLHHAAAADADSAHVQTVQVGLVAAHLGVLDHHLAVLDTGDVGRGTAHLKEQAIGQLFVHQSTGNACGRAGEDGQDGAAAHLVHGHHAAVAAHDHQRALDVRIFDALVGHGGGIQHLGHDAGVDHGGAGADLQTVQLGDLVGRCGRQAHFTADLDHPVLVLRVVHAEGLGGNKGLCPLLLQLLDSRADAAVQIRCIGVHIFVAAAQVLALRQLDVPHGGIALALCALQAAAQRDDADGGHIALQQGVGGLRGAVGDEDDILRPDLALLHDLVQHLYDAGSNALGGGMGGGDLYASNDLKGLVINGNGVGEGATNINSDTDFHKAKTSCFSFFFVAFRARADSGIRMGGPSISRRWNDKRAGYSDRPCSGLRTARCRRLVGEKTTQK